MADNETGEPATLPPVRNAEKRRTATCLFADRVAQVSVDLYRSVFPSKLQETQTCIATIVAHDRSKSRDNLTVLALGAGTKFLRNEIIDEESKASPYGRRIRDCHAEVLARRSFRRYLTLEIENHQKEDPGSFGPCILEKGHGSQYRLRNGVTLHFYVSSAPCGNAVLKKFATLKKEKYRGDLGPDEWPTDPHLPSIPGHNRSQGEVALLLKKDGTAQSDELKSLSKPLGMSEKQSKWPVNADTSWCPAGTTTVWSGLGRMHSCSDKLCRWNILGLQGALISEFFENERIGFETLVVGRKMSHLTCRRAICCRVASQTDKDTKTKSKKVPKYAIHGISHPAILGTAVYLDQGAISTCKSQGGATFTNSAWVWWPVPSRNGEQSVLEHIDCDTGFVMPSSVNTSVQNRVSSVSTEKLVEAWKAIYTGECDSLSRCIDLADLVTLKEKVAGRYKDKLSMMAKHPLLSTWCHRFKTETDPTASNVTY